MRCQAANIRNTPRLLSGRVFNALMGASGVMPRAKKSPPKKSEGTISDLRHGVHLERCAALLAGGGILVQNAFGHTLVDGFDRNLVSSGGLLAVAGGHCDVELLDLRLKSGLLHTVALVLDLRQLDSLLGRFNVGHGYTSSIAIAMIDSEKLKTFSCRNIL